MTLVKGSQMMRGPQISLFRLFYKKKRLQFFFYQGFLHRHWQFTGQQGKGGNHHLFLSTISTLSQTLRHLVVTLHVRWLSRIFSRNACVYQTATRRDLPPYRIAIWVDEWWCRDCIAVNTWNVTMKGMIASNTS